MEKEVPPRWKKRIIMIVTWERAHPAFRKRQHHQLAGKLLNKRKAR